LLSRREKVTDELKLYGIVFFLAEAGIKSFEKIITDLPGFQKSSCEPIRHFREGVTFPVKYIICVKPLLRSIFDTLARSTKEVTGRNFSGKAGFPPS